MEIIIFTSFVIAYMLVLITFVSYLFKSEIVVSRLKKILRTALKYNTVKNIEDVQTLYKGVKDTTISNSNHRHDLGRILRKMIIDVHIMLRKNKKEEKEEEIEQIDLMKKLKQLLEENERISPFSELPLQERMVFNDAVLFLEHNDVDAVKGKINELANFLVTANDRKVKSERLTKISFILAIISTIITVLSLIW